MKCPKCGFVSYAGLERCKKCGYAFGKAAPKGTSSSLITLFPEGVGSGFGPPQASSPTIKENPIRPERELPTVQASPPAPGSAQASPTQAEESTSGPTPWAGASQDWREELSERLENFRRRRSRLKRNTDSPGNLELDFENTSDKPAFLDDVLEKPGKVRPDLDLPIRESEAAPGMDGLSFEMPSREQSGEEEKELDLAPVGVADMSLGEPLPERPPLEIVVGPPEEETHAEDEVTEGIRPAPLGRRFLAGLMDAAVLVMAAAVFGVICWRFCGRLSLVPLNLIVLGLVAVIHIFAYFGLFCAVASATPGLMWMGCEIRNLRGGPPTLGESLWRAFGVLVSLAALMLGFVWAGVDSDGLTWHDRMSGTVITKEHSALTNSIREAES